MKNGLLLIFCFLPLVLFSQSYDHLSITHKKTSKNLVIKPGDRLIINGVNSGGKKFKHRGTVLKLEKEHIVFRARHKDIITEGQSIHLAEIKKIKIVNRKKHILLIITSIVTSGLIYLLAGYLFFSINPFGPLSFREELINGLVIGGLPIVLTIFSYLIINSGMEKIKNLQTDWNIEHIEMP